MDWNETLYLYFSKILHLLLILDKRIFLKKNLKIQFEK